MAMLAILNPITVDDMEGFMDTFDQAVTVPESETFESWCKRNDVVVRNLYIETDIGLYLLMHCPFFREPEFRSDARYEVCCAIHGGEVEYLQFLADTEPHR